jgi:AcrR family transcriptional regulator
MSPRPDVSEDRKNQILEAAIQVFSRRGFHQARMDEVAEEAGLSKGALYLYYKSKDAIIAALLKFFFAQELKKLRAYVGTENEGSISEQLLSMTGQLAADMQWLSALLPIAFEFYAVAARQKEVRQFLREHFGDYRQVLAALIQRGIDRGEFRVVDAETVAIALSALYEGLVLLWMVDPQAVQFEREGKASVRLLLEGIKT